jgi:hypothetical protein
LGGYVVVVVGGQRKVDQRRGERELVLVEEDVAGYDDTASVAIEATVAFVLR